MPNNCLRRKRVLYEEWIKGLHFGFEPDGIYTLGGRYINLVEKYVDTSSIGF